MTTSDTASALPTAVPHGEARWLIEPFRFGTPEQFAQLRGALESIGFDERAIRERAALPSIYDLAAVRVEQTPFDSAVDAQSVAVRLLIAGTLMPWVTVRSAFGAAVIDAFDAIGLLVSSPVDATMCAATVALYPIEGLFIASDRHGDMDPVAVGLPTDVVYSAFTPDARQFVNKMPRVPCGDYLELCSGTGIAAMIAARNFATQAWGVDITERSTRFARFNAALNAIDNATMLEGDLYEAVAGKTFDVISAHPPYVPALETTVIYRDAGFDGEQITRRIVGGLPGHLRPGGLFFCDCMLTDRKGNPLEHRIREMLGVAEAEFDLIVAQDGVLDLDAHMANAETKGRMSHETSEALRRRFEEMQVEQFVAVAFLIQRHAEPGTRPAITQRRATSPKTNGRNLVWALRWSALSPELERDPERVLASRPRHGADVELRSRSVLRNGKWTVTEAALGTATPFISEAKCPPWFATLLSWCDGQVTAREHLERLRDLELVAPTLSDGDFGSIIEKLAGGGFLELDFCPMTAPEHSSFGIA